MSGGSPRKDILFYSSFCEYCTNILTLINKKGIKNAFMLVCVDNKRYNLPSFVDRVPIIYTVKEELIYDDNITKYIESAFPTQTEEVMPFYLQSSTYSSQYETIMEVPCHQNMAYTPLGFDQKISTFQDDSDNGSKRDKLDSATLEKYIQERAMDLASFNKMSNGGFARQ